MLDARKARGYNENRVVSMVGQGTTVQGEIRSEGTLRIEGTVTGRVECTDSIVVQETGKVKAELLATQVIIAGEVHGNVAARERIEISAGGKVLGDICAPRISIAEGVLFEGKCTMKAPAPAAEPKPAPQPRAPATPQG